MKAIKKDKQGHYLMVKGCIQEEDITIINIYALNIGALRYLQQTLTDIKGEIHGNIITEGYFNTPLTSIDKSSRQEINKATEILKDTIEKVNSQHFQGITPKKNQNIHSSQVHIEHSQELIKYWGTKLTSKNLRI